jgi:8-oxo-dGTP pyrophosphatase MutT (NUDIX family)
MTPSPTRGQICRVLNATPESPRLNGDFAVAGVAREERVLTPAAVLVPLVERCGALTVLLTRRTDHLEHHPGQVSFPGGRAEEGDAGPVETALRETREEIGLHSRHVEIAGYLDCYQTVTGFLVTPVVGFVEPDFDLSPDTFEVAEVFEAPLDLILDPDNRRLESIVYKGTRRQFYVLPYKDYYIWGATAAMLVNLSEKLRASS